MLTRRTPLKRTAFQARPRAKKTEENREQALMRRAQAAMNSVVPRAAVVCGCCTAAPVPKAAPLRREKYRRAVASLPCAYCHIEGYSQHAHENEGKGKSQRLDDRRAMPLCCTRPGIEGCHVAFDQYRLVPGGRQAHVALGRAMAAKTRRQLNDLGLWPAGIPQFNEDEEA